MESLPFEDSFFDFATSLDVIEHLDDDVASLRELRRVVRPAGFLVVTVPLPLRAARCRNEHRRRYLRRTLIEAAGKAEWTSWPGSDEPRATGGGKTRIRGADSNYPARTPVTRGYPRGRDE